MFQYFIKNSSFKKAFKAKHSAKRCSWMRAFRWCYQKLHTIKFPGVNIQNTESHFSVFLNKCFSCTYQDVIPGRRKLNFLDGCVSCINRISIIKAEIYSTKKCMVCVSGELFLACGFLNHNRFNKTGE